jgi:hypothetical protein
MNFEKIAPFLKDPLILIGFFLFIAFLFIRTLVTKGTIPVLRQNQGFSILKLILLYGFIFGLLLIGLGFGLKYKEMSKAEQKNLVSLLVTELDGNIQIISELKKNTESFLSQQIELSKAIRTDGIKILPVMFPEANLNLDSNVNTNELAQQAFLELIDKKLAENKTEITKLEQFAKALTKTIRTVKSTNESLRDKERTRYKVIDVVWTSNLETYKKINVIDITLFQRGYTQMNNIRNDYDVIAGSTISFSDQLSDYFKDDNELTWENLATVLSIERQSYSLIVDYSKNLVNTLTDLNDIKDKLKINAELIQ